MDSDIILDDPPGSDISSNLDLDDTVKHVEETAALAPGAGPSGGKESGAGPGQQQELGHLFLEDGVGPRSTLGEGSKLGLGAILEPEEIPAKGAGGQLRNQQGMEIRAC